MNYFDNKVNNRVDIENSVLTYLDNCGVDASDYYIDSVVDDLKAHMDFMNVYDISEDMMTDVLQKHAK